MSPSHPCRGCAVLGFRPASQAGRLPRTLAGSHPFLSERGVYRLASAFLGRRLPRYFFISNECGAILKMAGGGALPEFITSLSR